VTAWILDIIGAVFLAVVFYLATVAVFAL